MSNKSSFYDQMVENDILRRILRLFVGTNSEKFSEYPTFISNHGIFDNPWYNFVIPKVSETNLDWEKTEFVIEKYKKLGKNPSYYVDKRLFDSYEEELNRKGYEVFGNDVYLVKNVKEKMQFNLPEGYSISTDYDIKEVIKILEKCFPNWSEESRYTKLWDGYKKHGQIGRDFETFVIYFDENIVASGSIVVDKVTNLAYLHNAGILATHRRKGLHTALVKKSINFAYESEISEVLAFVEKGGGSYRNCKKLGFKNQAQYFLFGDEV
jgi:hypothetical protein